MQSLFLIILFLIFSSYSASFAEKPSDLLACDECKKMVQNDYLPKNYTHLLTMAGFTEQSLKLHFQLYEGYVKNTNLLLKTLEDLSSQNKAQTYEYRALKRRLSWEFDGMRLHELYFDNLGGTGKLESESPLFMQILKDFGSYDRWKTDFISCGMSRGIGWVVLYKDLQNGRLINVWINEHDVGHLVGGEPILIMDVFEHAYMPQWGLEKDKYIDAFFAHIEWKVAAKRFESKLGK